MKHCVVIPLSRQEEDTLRLIAHGSCPAEHLPPDDVDQLAKLGLLDQHDGKVTLTGFGQIRLAQIKELQFQSLIRAARQQHLAGHPA